VGDVPAFEFSCGECAGPPYRLRGHVEGDFEVTLDFENGVGTLNTLDAELLNVEGNFGGDNWKPYAWEREFLPAGYYDDRLRPPYTGVLFPAARRPLGPGTLTNEHMAPYVGLRNSQLPDDVRLWFFQGVGFEPAPADSWILYFDGTLKTADERVTRIVSKFLIYFEGNRASFSYDVPIIDATPSIAAASAMRVPEPGQMASLFLWLCGMYSIRRRSCLR
jgi:hypothetical protein